jgi:hypothetical protein
MSINATTSYETITTSINEVDTPTEANNLVVKLYQKVSGNRPALADGVQVVDLRPAVRDDLCRHGHEDDQAAATWIQQDNATSSNGRHTARRPARTGSKNRRALVTFALPPIPYACSVSTATPACT